MTANHDDLKSTCQAYYSMIGIDDTCNSTKQSEIAAKLLDHIDKIIDVLDA